MHETSVGGAFGQVTALFEQTQTEHLPPLPAARPLLSGVGSVAPNGLASSVLRDCLGAVGVTDYDTVVSADLDDLTTRADWVLALVLSPYKIAALEACGALTAAARSAGVVDTIVRGADGCLHGVNTNAFGVANAVRLLMAGKEPRRILVLGTGATTRCAVVGLREQYGDDLDIGIYGRSPDKTAHVAEALQSTVVTDTGEFGADRVLNCTTVGETSDDDIPSAFARAITAAERFFDLNNRINAVQGLALDSGCVTISGNLMQRTVNSLRAHLLARGRD